MKKTFPSLTIFVICTVISAAAAVMSGCVRQTDTPIVAEKKENLTGNQAESREAPSPNAAFGQEDSVFRQIGTLPLTYQTKIQESGLDLEANAPVIIPDVSRIPLFTVENAPYPNDDCDTMLELISEETGSAQWTREKSSLTQLCTSSDDSYLFSFCQGDNSTSTPIMWLTNLNYSDATYGGFDPNDLSDFSMSDEEREALETNLKEKAEDFLNKMNQGQFLLKSARWKKISSAEKWEFTGKYGLRMTYVRSIGGIPVLTKGSGWASEPFPNAQYVDFVYMEDGTLLEMKSINHERLVSERGYVDFLLPFDSISQIFEQYIKYYQTIYEPPYSYTADTSAGQKLHLYIDVTKVEFAYQLQYEGFNSETSDKGTGKGSLVPVWAFYGTLKIGYDFAEDAPNSQASGSYAIANTGTNDALLLTINAKDGTIYGKTAQNGNTMTLE